MNAKMLVKENNIVRILSVTSINQLFIGLACMKKNSHHNNKYKDYLIMNNTRLLDDTAEGIKKASSFWDFDKVIDFRNNLAIINNDMHERKFFYKVIYKIIDILLAERKINKVISLLRINVNEKNIDEIYVRYKINQPEKIFLSAFPEAAVYSFEDGLGDYAYKNLKDKEQDHFISLRRFIIKIIKFIVAKITFSKLQHGGNLYSRITGIYELLGYRHGHRKQFLLKNTGLTFNNIANEYKHLIKNVSENFVKCAVDRSFVLLFASGFSDAGQYYSDKEKIEVIEDIKYTESIVLEIKNLYPNSEIIIRLHPRTSRELVEAYNNNFLGGVCKIDSSSNFPAEAYFAFSHLEAVVAGSYSSSLMYATQLFNKKAFFCSPTKHLECHYTEGQRYLNEKVLERLGVKKIKIHETLFAA